MAFEQFGPYASIFASGTSYLSLLRLCSEETEPTIDRIQSALGKNAHAQGIHAMLSEPNWRPHLVAALAITLNRGEFFNFNPLWCAIDAGSWVTPQLVVTALFSDPAFASQVVSRIETHCSVTPPQIGVMIERHSATGPAGLQERRAKMAASLMSVVPLVPSLTAHAHKWRESPAIQQLLIEDTTFDNSGKITLEWSNELKRIFAKRGITLSPLSL